MKGKIKLIISIIILAVLIIMGLQLFNKPKESQVTINNATFKVELAVTPKEMVKGLGGRTGLQDDQGMLFPYDKPRHNRFWMRGMKFPIDIIFIQNNKVVAVYENLPPAADEDPSPPQVGSEVLSDHVLEINAGLAKKNNIKVGDEVNIYVKKNE